MSPENANLENLRIMNQIITAMKEIPQLPSEVPKDQSRLDKVEFPSEGGMLTYMDGHEFPYRGFPFFEIVDKIDLVKKISRGTLSGLYHQLKGKNKFRIFTLIPALWMVRPLVYSTIYSFHRIIVRSRIHKERYSQPCRELYRIFSIESLGEDRELRLMLRDVICMILEFDNAYRFRVQDIFAELNRENIKKNTVKELLRLMDIMMSREKTQDLKDTWTLGKLFISLYLRIDRKLKNVLGDALFQLDINEIKLSKEDKHYCLKRLDYHFKFMEQQEELKDLLVAYTNTNAALEKRIAVLEGELAKLKAVQQAIKTAEPVKTESA